MFDHPDLQDLSLDITRSENPSCHRILYATAFIATTCCVVALAAVVFIIGVRLGSPVVVQSVPPSVSIPPRYGLGTDGAQPRLPEDSPIISPPTADLPKYLQPSKSFAPPQIPGTIARDQH